jgi:hypothetical protein
VAGGWRKLHNEELHDLYRRNIVRAIRSSRMRWAGMVIKNAHKILSCKQDGTKPFKRPGMILALIFKRART